MGELYINKQKLKLFHSLVHSEEDSLHYFTFYKEDFLFLFEDKYYIEQILRWHKTVFPVYLEMANLISSESNFVLSFAEVFSKFLFEHSFQTATREARINLIADYLIKVITFYEEQLIVNRKNTILKPALSKIGNCVTKLFAEIEKDYIRHGDSLDNEKIIQIGQSSFFNIFGKSFDFQQKIFYLLLSDNMFFPVFTVNSKQFFKVIEHEMNSDAIFNKEEAIWDNFLNYTKPRKNQPNGFWTLLLNKINDRILKGIYKEVFSTLKLLDCKTLPVYNDLANNPNLKYIIRLFKTIITSNIIVNDENNNSLNWIVMNVCLDIIQENEGRIIIENVNPTISEHLNIRELASLLERVGLRHDRLRAFYDLLIEKYPDKIWLRKWYLHVLQRQIDYEKGKVYRGGSSSLERLLQDKKYLWKISNSELVKIEQHPYFIMNIDKEIRNKILDFHSYGMPIAKIANYSNTDISIVKKVLKIS